jgi:NAD(P)-dependent dehydrogenase (short-subunit alcohol dehydrogenase family)
MTQDTASLQGRNVFITGANTGIGRVTARELARRGAHVYVAGKSRERTQALIDEVQGLAGAGHVEWLPLDLGDLASVRACAADFLSRNVPLHILINNAGLAGTRGLTQDGFELAFGVNHLGHFLLTQLLLERIQQSAPARIVTVSSRAHYRCKKIAWDGLRQRTATTTAIDEYAQSKLANLLFSAELSRRLAGTGVTTYSLHPGVVATEVWRHVPWFLQPFLKLAGMITAEEGAQTTLHCATAPALANETGLYYDRCATRTPSALVQDLRLAKELWERSEALVK